MNCPRMLCVLAALSTATCSTPRIEGLVQAHVGREGGELVLPRKEGSVAIRIPPGALEGPTSVTARLVEPMVGAFGSVLELGPAGLQLAVPAEVSLTLEDSHVWSHTPRPLMQVARLEEGSWRLLPTSHPTRATVIGHTQGPGLFAAVPRCHVAGRATHFQLAGCAAFNSSITASQPIDVRARAGAVSLTMTVAAQPSSSEPVDLTVGGLAPSTLYFLKLDGGLTRELSSDGSGKVRISLDVTKEHLVLISSVHGSIQLSPSTCVPPVGRMEAGALHPTCRLLQDIPDADVTLDADDLALDCRDFNNPLLFHQIGSLATRHSFGVLAFQRQHVAVLNCPILNVDTGISVQSSANVTVQFSSISLGAPGTAGVGVSHLNSSFGEYSNTTIAGVDQGMVAFNSDHLTVMESIVDARFEAVLFQGQGETRLERVHIDDSISSFAPPTGPPANAVVLSNLQNAEVATLSVRRRMLFEHGVWLLNSTAQLSDVTVQGALVGVMLDLSDATVTESTLTGNDVGLKIVGGVPRIFRNNIFANTTWQVSGSGPLELSRTTGSGFPVPTGEGNYWGHACPGQLFTGGTDSSAVDVVDSYPYGNPSGWNFEASGCGGRSACIVGGPQTCAFPNGCPGVPTCAGTLFPNGGCWCPSIPGGGTASATCTVCGGQGTITCDLTTCGATGRCTRQEVCNRCDDDGDGQIDNGVPTLDYYRDNDGDGFGGATSPSVPFSCAALPPGFVLDNSDCNDSNANINRRVKEVCGNGIDDNCSGVADEGTPPLTVFTRTVNGAAVAGAEVFLNGVSFGMTDSSGLLITPSLPCGDQVLFARSKAAPDTMEYRRGPSNWLVRYYLTSRVVQIDGTVSDHLVVDPSVTQVLTVDPRNTMIGWRLVVSMMFDASEDDFSKVSTALREASQYLYNLTDGQFFIEEVEIGDEGELEPRAEILLTNDTSLRAYSSHPGGFTGPAIGTNPVIWIAPFRANGSRRTGSLYIHELGHLAMGLQDEYDNYTPEAQCTAIRTTMDPQFGMSAPRSACAMDSQTATRKLCSVHKDSTHRWGGSWQPGPCWETVYHGWSDPASTDRWMVVTPDRRNPHQLVGTLDLLPSGLTPSITTNNIDRHPLCAPITFADPDGPAAEGRTVWVMDSESSMFPNLFTAGKLDTNGTLIVRGAHAGDLISTSLSASSFTITATAGGTCTVVH